MGYILILDPRISSSSWSRGFSKSPYHSNEVKIMRIAGWFGIGLGIFIIIFPFIYNQIEYGNIKIVLNLLGSGFPGIVALTFLPMFIIYPSIAILFSIREIKKIYELEQQIGITHPQEPSLINREVIKRVLIYFVVLSILSFVIVYGFSIYMRR